MNSPSSNTFNVGAPTFGAREQSSRFCNVILVAQFPNWNDTPGHPPMNLETNSLVKPSSNTLNVGAPTFSPYGMCRGGFRPPSSPLVTDLKVGHYNCQHAGRQAVSQ
jgi:hypothetical protein